MSRDLSFPELGELTGREAALATAEEWVRRDVARAARCQRRFDAATEKFHVQTGYECGPRCRVAAQRGWQEGSHEGCPYEGGTSAGRKGDILRPA